MIISGTHCGDYVAQYLAHSKHLIHVSFACILAGGENAGRGHLMEISEVHDVQP